MIIGMDIINSHQQIPQLLLKYFAHENLETFDGTYPHKVKYVFYLDLKTFTIEEEKMRLFGASKYYFDKETENYLSSKVEGPFSKAISKMAKRNFKLLDLNQMDFLAINRFAYYSELRSERVIDSILKGSLSKIYPKLTVDQIIKSTIETSYFSESQIYILENNTDRDFVVPYNCLSCIKLEGNDYHFLPISPKMGLALSKNKKGEEKKYSFITKAINDESVVNKINLVAFDIENRNKGLIVSLTEEELVKLVKSVGKTINKRRTA